jgi:hypothetical protein
MDRSRRRRICEIEKLLSAAKKKREEEQKKSLENRLLHARFHATAVAAIVLSGEPKIDEPLNKAWARALQHYGIPIWQQHGIVARTHDQVRVAKQLLPVIIGEAEESARFTEIFRRAPGWLLGFTFMFVDAGFLKFELPDKAVRSKWGRAGYEESRGWPLLPLGRMTDGDPVSDEDARLWPFPLGVMKGANTIPDFEDNPSQAEQDDEDQPSPGADFLEDWTLVLDLEENPEKEKELSRYEKHRLRDLFERIAADAPGDD